MKKVCNKFDYGDIFAIIYADLLNFCKQKKLKVYHRKNISSDIDGWYRFSCIHLKTEYKYTEYGITVLAHEIGHAFQDRRGEMNFGILYQNKIQFTEKNFEKICRMEIDASVKAQKLLFDRYGYVFDFSELDQDLVENSLKDFWRLNYFNIKE